MLSWIEPADEPLVNSEHAALRKVEVGHVSVIGQGSHRSEVFIFNDSMALGDIPDAPRIRIEVLPVGRG
jgi:hypothetical protein